MKTSLSLSTLALLVTACGSTAPPSNLNTYKYDGVYYSRKMNLNDQVSEHNLLRMCDGAKCERAKKTDPAMHVFPNHGAGCIFQTPKMDIASGRVNKAYIDFDIDSASPGIKERTYNFRGERTRFFHKTRRPEMRFTVEIVSRDSAGKIQIHKQQPFKVQSDFGKGQRTSWGRHREIFEITSKRSLKDVRMRICLASDELLDAKLLEQDPNIETANIAENWSDGGYPNVSNVMDMRPQRLLVGSNQMFVFAIYEAYIQYK